MASSSPLGAAQRAPAGSVDGWGVQEIRRASNHGGNNHCRDWIKPNRMTDGMEGSPWDRSQETQTLLNDWMCSKAISRCKEVRTTREYSAVLKPSFERLSPGVFQGSPRS